MMDNFIATNEMKHNG